MEGNPVIRNQIQKSENSEIGDLSFLVGIE